MDLFASLLACDQHSDSDGDGFSDYDEFVAATSPTDAQDYLKIIAYETDQVNGTFYLQFNSQPGRVYEIQYASDLGLPKPWLTSEHSNFVADGMTTDRTLNNLWAHEQRFSASGHRPLAQP